MYKNFLKLIILIFICNINAGQTSSSSSSSSSSSCCSLSSLADAAPLSPDAAGLPYLSSSSSIQFEPSSSEETEKDFHYLILNNDTNYDLNVEIAADNENFLTEILEPREIRTIKLEKAVVLEQLGIPTESLSINLGQVKEGYTPYILFTNLECLYSDNQTAALAELHNRVNIHNNTKYDLHIQRNICAQLEPTIILKPNDSVFLNKNICYIFYMNNTDTKCFEFFQIHNLEKSITVNYKFNCKLFYVQKSAS